MVTDRNFMTWLGLGALSLFVWAGAPACSDDDSGNKCIPQPETCNGLDDDCDGQTDEGGTAGRLRQSCSTDCGTGYEYCVDGQWEGCDAPQPETEVCDGVDNDCNGQTDETCDCVAGTTRPCGTDEGVCQQGTEECRNGVWTNVCTGGVEPAADDSDCNGLDDDCDGETDEDCTCDPGDEQPCGTDEGECAKGTQSCLSDGSWGECRDAVEPVDETCDGLDNDCDGLTDNGLPGDDYEQNNECQQGVYTDLGTVDEGAGPSTFNATLYPADDVDWYKIHYEEGIHACGGIGDPQCFWSEFKITLPEGITSNDVLISFIVDTDGQCGGDQQIFTSDDDPTEWDGQTWDLVLAWNGECWFDDSWDFFVKVEYKDPNNVQPACTEYTVSAEMGYVGSEECE